MHREVKMGSELIAAALIAAFAITRLIIPAAEHVMNEIGLSEGMSALLSKAVALVSNPIFDFVAILTFMGVFIFFYIGV